MLIKIWPFKGSAAAGIITVNQFTARNMENFNTGGSDSFQLSYCTQNLQKALEGFRC